MPAKSQAQQKFMGMVHALNKGDIKPSDVSQSVKDVAKTIKKSDAKDFASTKHNKIPKKVKEQLLTAFKEYANKMAGNKLGGSGSYGYAPQKGLRDDDGYDNEGPKDEGFASDAQRRAAFASGYKAKGKKGKKESSKYRSLFYTNEGMFSTIDQIRQDSKNVRDFVKNIFKDRDFAKMKNDKEFIKYLKSIYEGKMPNNWMSGRVSDYHTALRGKNKDYSGGTNFKKNNHGQPDIENDDEDQETNSLSVKQTPIKENYMMNRDVEEEMKKHGIKKIPIDSHGDRLLKGLKKEKFINKIDNKLKLTYFYATVPKGQRYNYASLKKPLSPLFNRFMNDLMGENIILTSKMAAYRVSQNIIDMYNNNEEIDSPYYMLKNYFNSFNMDTSRSRVFNGAQYHLDQWLKRNKKYEKAMMREDMGKLSSSERIELYKLYSKAMKAMPGSPNQKKIKVLINKLRKKADLKPLPISEYGQRLDLSYLEDMEMKLKGTPEPKDAIDRDIDETTLNEIGVFPIQNYIKGIIPSKDLNIMNDRDRERVKSLIKDLVFTLNDFWKSHKIPFRVREPRKSDMQQFKKKIKR
jgi:hypothetical protein